MAKPFKILLAIAGLLLLLVIGGATAALLLFNPNDYRGRIEAEVKKNTGRELKLGALELKIFPWLAISADAVSLGNAPGFGSEPFAQIGQARAGVKVLPLLFEHKVEISTLKLSGLVLNLAVNKDGHNNWADLAEAKADDKSVDVEVQSSFKLEEININGVDISDAALSYDDQQADVRYTLKPLNLSTGELRFGEPVDLKLSASVAASEPAAQADIELSARIRADAKQVQASGMQLSFKGGNNTMKAEGSLAGDAQLDLETMKLAMESLTLTLKPQMSDLNADTKLKARLAADLKAQLFELSGLQLELDASGKSIPGGQQHLALSAGELSFNAKSGALRMADVLAQAAGLSIKTQIAGEGLMGDTPRLSGPLSIETFNPRELLGKLGIAPPQTADASVLKTASFKADYNGNFKSAALTKAVLTLDQSTARGSLNLRDFGTQAIQFALKLDQLDADRYLPPKPKTAAGAGGGDKANINDISIPAETLNQLNAEGTLDVALLKLNGLKLEDVTLRLAGGKGQVKSQTVNAKLYGGGITLANQFTPGSKPAYAIKTSLNSLSTGPFLQDFVGKDYLSGLGALTLDLNSGGLTVGDLRKSLNGEVGFKLDKGAIKGFNLAQILRKGQAALAGNLNYTEDAPKQTDFSAISASAVIVNGILKSDKLDAASPLFRLIGSGEINLVDETINYLARPTIVESSKGEGGAGLDQLRGLVIPIKLTGSLFSPSYKLDLQEVLKQKAFSKLTGKIDASKEELKAKEDEAKDKLRQKLNDRLNQWFKPKPAEPAPAPAADPAPPTAPAPAEPPPPSGG